MLTAEQIAAFRDQALKITDPINDFLLEDIARRISEAGQLTSTASYQVWRAQQLGMSQQEIKKRLKKLLKVSTKEIEQLLTQSAEVGYDFDIKNLPHTQAVPFEENESLQQIVEAAIKLAQDDFTNLTQTLGMVDPYGNELPLQDAYRSCTDYAFKQVITGATDYNTAIRRATKNLADKGVRVIDYESGVHTSLEAAIRRNIMGGLGLMQEQISQKNHDDLGADGWEISAHANSAPDHEPIQGRQYSDAEYEALNNSMVRRIGTLNCGHAAFPVILGVNPPQYTPKELEKFRQDNEKGVTVDGKHYTGYEATQMQRKLERAMRTQKRRILTAEAAGDKDTLTVAQTRLQRLRQEYSRFSKAAGLRTEGERIFVAHEKTKMAAADAKRNTGRVVKYDPAADFSIRLSGYSEEVQGGLSKASGIVAKEGGADGLEHLQLVDLESGLLLYHENGHETEVGGPEFWKYVREHPNQKIAFVHNHTTDGYFSESDMQTLLRTDNIKMFVAVRLDGVKYIAEKTGKPPAGFLFDHLYQKELDSLTQQYRNGIITAGERTSKRELLLVDNLLRDYTKGLIELDGRN